jgi:hypothetical protein
METGKEHMAVTSKSEWLLFNANSAIFSYIMARNKLIFNKMMTRSALF